MFGACQAPLEAGFAIGSVKTVRVGEPFSLPWAYTGDEEGVVLVRYEHPGAWGAPIETIVIPPGVHSDTLRAFSIGDEATPTGRYALGLESFRTRGNYTITLIHAPCSILANPCASIAAPSEIAVLEARDDERLTIERITIIVD